MLLAKEGYAVENTSTGTVTLNKGIVFAYGTTFTNVISGTNTVGTGSNTVVAAWDYAAGKIYTAGTDDDIYRFPSPPAGTIVWAKEGGNSVISVNYNGNKGFIPLADVTVGTTGIETITNDTFRIYPNPTGNVLNFSLATPFEMIDLQGRILLKSEKAVKSVNITDLPSGVYFVKLKTEKGEVIKKVLKE
jgi:hypothetical protein